MTDKELETLTNHIDNCINNLKTFLLSFVNTDKEDKPRKIISWIKNWINYLTIEHNTDKYRKFKRGSVVYVNFGYNIGNELGGEHYAVVIDNHDQPYSSLLTIIPMTSLKENETINDFKINIGSELKNKVSNQLLLEISKLKAIINNQNNKQYDRIYSKLNNLIKIKKRFDGMKESSIIRVNQIKTISKLRIINPKHSEDFLSNIILSNNTLDKINDKIVDFYTKNNS